MKVKLELPSADELIAKKGLTANGSAQTFHTNNVLNRITKYMPYRSGATIKLTMVQTDISKPEIVTDVPYGKFLYYGKLMVDPVTGAAGFLDKDGMWKSRKGVPKVVSERPIVYDKTKNPMAGSFWDRALVANEGAALVDDLQEFINRGGK